MPNLFSLVGGIGFVMPASRLSWYVWTMLFVGDVDAKELEALNLLHCSPVDENGGMRGALFPVVHNHLLCLDHIEGEFVVLAQHGKLSDLLPIGCRVVV